VPTPYLLLRQRHCVIGCRIRDTAADPGVIPIAALVIARNVRSRGDGVINIAVLGATVLGVTAIKAVVGEQLLFFLGSEVSIGFDAWGVLDRVLVVVHGQIGAGH
jgi:hypothetical protein